MKGCAMLTDFLDQKLMIVLELGLRPVELATFMVILKYENLFGSCKVNSVNLSKEIKCSKDTLTKVKTTLSKMNLISVKKEFRKSGFDGDSINTYMTDAKLLDKLLS